MILKHLPPESAYQTAVREALTPEQVQSMADAPVTGYGPFSREAMILARLVDQVARLEHSLIVLNIGKGKPPPPPDPFPRPGVPLPRSTTARGGTFVPPAYLERMREQHRQLAEEADSG